MKVIFKNKDWTVVEQPPMCRSVFFDFKYFEIDFNKLGIVEFEGCEKTYYLSFPYIIFAWPHDPDCALEVSFKKEATKSFDKIEDAHDCRLLTPALPNIEDLEVCFGDNNVPENINDVVALFWQSPFNNYDEDDLNFSYWEGFKIAISLFGKKMYKKWQEESKRDANFGLTVDWPTHNCTLAEILNRG
jgi:hypothetical protein